MRDILHNKVSKTLFQVTLIGFQKFFMFWIALIILEVWNVELESAHFFDVTIPEYLYITVKICSVQFSIPTNPEKAPPLIFLQKVSS